MLLIVLLAVPRFMYLDQDIPAYMVSGLSQEDEPYYCIGGINEYLKDEGRLHPDFISSDISALQVVNTPTTYFSLKCAGNNYYGLRLPVVIISLIVIIAIVFFARRRTLSGTQLFALTLFMSFEFYTFLMSRFYNPQIFCILFITFILILFHSEKIKPSWIAFGVGLLCSIMVLGVYLYTVYFAGAIGIWYFIRVIREKKYKLLVMLAGGVLSGVILWLFYLLIFKIDLKELIGNLVAHGGGVEAETGAGSTGIKKMVLAFTQIITTNLFRYNYFLIAVFVALTAFAFRKMRTNRSALLYVLILLLFILQNYFVQSYPFKKHVIFYPVLLIFVIVNLKDIIYWLKNELRMWQRSVLILVSLVLIYYCDRLNNSEQYWSGFNYGYYENIPFWIRFAGLTTAFLFTLVVFLFYEFSKLKINWPILLMFCFIPSAALITDQFYVKKTFATKEALADMRKYIEKKYMMQEFSHAFQFYSNCVPLMSNYDRITIAKTDIPELYRKTGAYMISKSFRNDKRRTLYTTGIGSFVEMNGMKFRLIAVYPLRYYNYYLLKFTDPNQLN
jgi:hypothetical protein